ncbi:ribosome small subunit-dependent GTPase A [candidate division KSB1 bacterium]|nr:ribosome small subunit-dependent GTPase A [candidate division KSB1 bacterium]RQW01604.1 MAG: ribosome small subunit-dependent GTPase A [candidate division KSB1 bacterium]
MTLTDLGWDDYFQAQLGECSDSGLVCARVSRQQKKQYRVLTETGEHTAVILGKFRHQAESLADFPAVGDWVLVQLQAEEDKAVIHHVLPRKTKISRDTTTRKGRRPIADEQVLVANVDAIFLVTALNEELNLRRIERYLTVIWDSGAKPVLLLNKSDLCDHVDDILPQIEQVAIGVDVHVLSAAKDEGLDVLQRYLGAGKTVALLGSSGVGKSTIINKIIGVEKFKVSATGEYKDKGRHITTHREMVLLDSGGILIDNPGMRSIQLWDGEDGMAKSFADIEQIAVDCRFKDCRHVNEPGCAVLRAVAAKELPAERYESYLKLQKELDYRARKENWSARQNTKKRWKSIAKSIRQLKNDRHKGFE